MQNNFYGCLCDMYGKSYIFLCFVAPKNSILLIISGFHAILRNGIFFVFHIESNI